MPRSAMTCSISIAVARPLGDEAEDGELGAGEEWVT